MYNSNRKMCSDLNECTIGTHNCVAEEGEHCINVDGSFFCKKDSDCPQGFKVNKNTGDCEDIDECAEGIDNCRKEQQFCFNTKGSFSCQDKGKRTQCLAGYKYNILSRSCEDINECEERKHNCAIEQVCINLNGSFSCLSHITPPVTLANDPSNRCAAGFRYNITRQLCVDIDECGEQIHVCSKDTETCINEPGGYRCSPKSAQDEEIKCPIGFQKSLFKDECI
ncbi:hypothetical protein J437_LFUL008110, partial [Ladona fulva]